MEQKERKPDLTILTNIPVEFELNFDKPIEGDSISKIDNKSFHWHIFSVKCTKDDMAGNKAGMEYVVKSGDTLWAKRLKEFKRYDVIALYKKEEKSLKFNKMIKVYDIRKVGSNAPDAPVEQSPVTDVESDAELPF